MSRARLVGECDTSAEQIVSAAGSCVDTYSYSGAGARGPVSHRAASWRTGVACRLRSPSSVSREQPASERASPVNPDLQGTCTSIWRQGNTLGTANGTLRLRERVNWCFAASVELVLRASDGRYRPRHDEGTLRRLIREVARMARPLEPRMLSEAEFDLWRLRSSWPDAPSASCICKRLGLAWREVVALALHAERDWARTIGKRRQVTPIEELSDEEIAQALRFADRRAGGRPLRPALYDA